MKETKPDTNWDDEEIVIRKMSPDTRFVFDQMTRDFLDCVAAAPGEEVLDVACGRAIDATHIWRRGAHAFGLEPSHVMLDKAAQWLKDGSPPPVLLIRGLAEALPFADNSFDKVVCKGAIDHFMDLHATFSEMVRVTRPTGRIVIAVANFESLGCLIGRTWDKMLQSITGRPGKDQPFWIPPQDHNHKFDYALLHKLMEKYCRIKSMSGVSMLWGTPYWGWFLEQLPPAWSTFILESLHSHAQRHPRFSDVLICTGLPRK